ncbi:MAG: tetratricopeptide repeat protein [Acidobacteria bacterium]|nr:tetratricopeptide repeat protein [Acidobacteriota bacterium]
MRKHLLAVVVLSAVGLAVTWPPLRGQAQAAEEQLARQRLESGLKFLESRNYPEALKDFRAVAVLYGKSSVADEALLLVATCEFEATGNLGAAEQAAADLLTKYPNSKSAPMAYVLLGRIAVARGRTKENFDSAIASYQRAQTLFKRSDAVAAAIFYAGEAHRLNGNHNDAIASYREVTVLYPRSIWAARAQIGLATTLVRAAPTREVAGRAMEELQRVRQRFPDTRDAAIAVARLTILYRLYVLPQLGQPPYVPTSRKIGGTTGKLKDITALAIGPADEIAITNDQWVGLYDKSGTVLKTAPLNPSYGAFFLPDGRAVQIGKGAVRILDQQAAVALAVPKPDNTLRPLDEIPAAAALSSGDLLVADAGTKSVLRFSPSGKYLNSFAGVYARRLAVDDLDQVAMLDRDTKSVVVADRNGRTLYQIPSRGKDYELRDPIDITFDAFGHLYVLDRDNAAVFMLTPAGKLIASFTIAEKSPGAFRKSRAMALDSAGRLYIFDDRALSVQIYQ